ncbi:MAG: OmpH family outer membrane protein [Halanaerobiales bacterium]|nr:OmpH family outer membrane protein [Halanaerobiales bacterium]
MRAKKFYPTILLLILLLVIPFLVMNYIKKGNQEVEEGFSQNGYEESYQHQVLDDPEKDVTQNEVLAFEEIKIGVVDMDTLRTHHPKYSMISKLEVEIQSYFKELARQTDGQKEAQIQVESQYSDLNAQFYSQLEEIQEKYQKKIDEKTEILQQELISFEEKTWDIVVSDFQKKKDDVEVMAEEMISRYNEKQMESLAVSGEELMKKYYPEILNFRLKLQMVQLSEEEQKKYRDELEKLEFEQARKIEEEKVRLEEELNQYIETKQSSLEQELQDFQNKTKEDAELDLENKRNELDNNLQTFIQDMDLAMQAEIKEKQIRLEEQAQTGLLKAQDEIQNDMRNNEELLKSKIAEAKQEQNRLKEEIDDEIRTRAQEVAKAKNFDLVLTNIKTNVDAVDITEQVLQKLN